MTILNTLLINKRKEKTEKEKERELLNYLVDKMIYNIDELAKLSNPSPSYNKDELSSALQWLDNHITTFEKTNSENDYNNYLEKINVIFNYLITIYSDEIDDENFLNFISDSFKLLKRINKIICYQFGQTEYKLDQFESMQQSISVKLSNVTLKNKSELQLELLKKETNNILNESISTFNTRTADLYSDLSQSINKKINEQISNRQKEIDKEIMGFAELKSQLSKQVQLYSSATLADQNRVQAEEEGKTADILRIIGGIWLLIVSSISFYFFYDLLNTDKTSEMSVLIFRWMSVLLMTIPGIYILRESSIHRTDARNYRRLAIQLATIDSYLTTFEKDEAKEVKRSLISNFFSSEETKTDFSSVPDLLKSFEKVQDTILSIASKQSSQAITPKKEETTENKKKEEPSLSSVS